MGNASEVNDAVDPLYKTPRNRDFGQVCELKSVGRVHRIFRCSNVGQNELIAMFERFKHRSSDATACSSQQYFSHARCLSKRPAIYKAFGPGPVFFAV